MLRKFLRDRCGAASAEYALILSIAGIAIGAAALGLGANIAAAVGTAGKVVYDTRHPTDASAAASAGQSNGKNGGNGLDTAPGQNPSSGNGNSNGNQTPGSPPSNPPGKKQ